MKAVLMLVIVALAGCAGQVEPEPRTVRVEMPLRCRAECRRWRCRPGQRLG